MTTRAIGYIRVSTSEQADSGLSLAAQRKKIEAQATLSELTLVDVLQDAGETAKDLHRPALTDLLNRIDTGQIACVIVAKLDRLTRSTKDLADLLSTFKEKQVDFISTAESFDTSSATGRTVLNMIGVIAQWERESISERTSAALQEKRAQGRATGGVPPFGYDFIDGGARRERAGADNIGRDRSHEKRPANLGRASPIVSQRKDTAPAPAATSHDKASSVLLRSTA